MILILLGKHNNFVVLYVKLFFSFSKENLLKILIPWRKAAFITFFLYQSISCEYFQMNSFLYGCLQCFIECLIPRGSKTHPLYGYKLKMNKTTQMF